jgi:hypothetical protein
MKTSTRQVNWIPLPDSITEDEVELQISWTADKRTTQAILRQADLMGFESGTDYLLQLIAATIASNEEDTILTDDGRILNGRDGYDRNGLPQNV